MYGLEEGVWGKLQGLSGLEGPGGWASKKHKIMIKNRKIIIKII